MLHVSPAITCQFTANISLSSLDSDACCVFATQVCTSNVALLQGTATTGSYMNTHVVFLFMNVFMNVLASENGKGIF